VADTLLNLTVYPAKSLLFSRFCRFILKMLNKNYGLCSECFLSNRNQANKMKIENDISFLKREIEKIIKESLESQDSFNFNWINEIMDVADKTKTGLKINCSLLKQLNKKWK